MEQTAEVVDTVVQTGAAAPQNGFWGMVLYCFVVIGVIYLVMVRPNKKRMAEYQKMLDSLKVGNRVMAAGIYGTIKKSYIATRTEPLYGNVCYQRTRTRTITDPGKTQNKWSSYNDTSLLNNGWYYTGAKRAK